MTPAERGALLVATLALVRDHCDLLTDERMRVAQAHALEQVGALVEAATDADGAVHLRGEQAVLVFTRLVDAVARLRRAADTPRLGRVRTRLQAWQDELIRVRDAAITSTIRRGPARRRTRDNGRGGWNAPPPGEGAP